MGVEADLAPEVESNLKEFAVERDLTEKEAASMLIAHGLDAVSEGEK